MDSVPAYIVGPSSLVDYVPLWLVTLPCIGYGEKMGGGAGHVDSLLADLVQIIWVYTQLHPE